MRLKPMYLGFTNANTLQFHSSDTLHLPPATFTVSAFQIPPNVHSPALSDCLNMADPAKYLKLHPHPELPAFTDLSIETRII